MSILFYSAGGNTCNRLIGYNLITKGNTNAPKTSQNFINSIESSSTTTTTPQRVASKAPKPPVLPNIRYHPYPNIKSGETKENSKASENTAVCTFFQQPCNSASNVTSPANHVHSVSVPRGGSYTTPKSSNESQSIRKSPGDDVSNDSSKVKVGDGTVLFDHNDMMLIVVKNKLKKLFLLHFAKSQPILSNLKTEDCCIFFL